MRICRWKLCAATLLVAILTGDSTAFARPEELKAVPIRLGATNMPAAVPASQIPNLISSSKVLQGSVSQSAIAPGTMLCPYGLWYVQKGKKGFPAKITFVEKGSAAYKAGVRVDDTLLAAGLVDDKINIMVSRSGKTYSTSIHYFQGKDGSVYAAKRLTEKVAQPESILNMF